MSSTWDAVALASSLWSFPLSLYFLCPGGWSNMDNLFLSNLLNFFPFRDILLYPLVNFTDVFIKTNIKKYIWGLCEDNSLISLEGVVHVGDRNKSVCGGGHMADTCLVCVKIYLVSSGRWFMWEDWQISMFTHKRHFLAWNMWVSVGGRKGGWLVGCVFCLMDEYSLETHLFPMKVTFDPKTLMVKTRLVKFQLKMW